MWVAVSTPSITALVAILAIVQLRGGAIAGASITSLVVIATPSITGLKLIANASCSKTNARARGRHSITKSRSKCNV